MKHAPDTDFLREWLEETEGGPPDPVEGTREAMSHLDETKQASRWWPFPVFYRGAQTTVRPPTTTDTTDYQPSPIPASNGHTPTVIGRTSSMLSPTKAITAGALVFALGGVMLIAQPFDQQGNVPGAAIDPCTTPITPVTGEIIWGEQEPNSQYYSSDAGIHIRDYGYVSTLEVDDDRLDGQSTGAVDWDLGHEQTTGVNQGTFRIDNDEGTWEGTWTGIARSMASWKAVIDLTGNGAYEGLSARLFTESGATGPIDGSVYPTDLASCDFSTGE